MSKNKKLLINIRGASASGKTTIVKQFLERFGFSVEKVKTPFADLPVSVVDGGGVVVLGDYSANGNCLGVDRYHGGKSEIIDAIISVEDAYHPNIIIYEHMLSSHVSKGPLEIAEVASHFGYEFLGLQIALSEEKRMQNLMCRSGGAGGTRTFNKNNGEKVSRASERLREAGINCIVVDVENTPKENMWRVLDGAIRKALE